MLAMVTSLLRWTSYKLSEALKLNFHRFLGSHPYFLEFIEFPLKLQAYDLVATIAINKLCYLGFMIMVLGTRSYHIKSAIFWH